MTQEWVNKVQIQKLKKQQHIFDVLICHALYPVKNSKEIEGTSDAFYEEYSGNGKRCILYTLVH